MALSNSHEPGEYNAGPWDAAANARRILQQRRAAGQSPIEISAEPMPEELAKHFTPEVEAARRAQEVRHAPHTHGDLHVAETESFDPGSIEERLHRLGEEPIQMQMRRRLVGSQAPEPVIEVVGRAGAEGAKVTQRLWAVDDEEFNKQAGDTMTDEEFDAVRKRLKPVQWNEKGEPVEYAPAHDPIDPTDGTGQHVPTRREREEAKQYAVRSFIPATEKVPATEHTILPDPFVEPVDPDLP